MERIHQMKSGRWIVATWDERGSQWRSSNIGTAPFQGYCYTSARSLEGLAMLGIRTYAKRSSAERAAKRIFGED
jgi:hypothetical protein